MTLEELEQLAESGFTDGPWRSETRHSDPDEIEPDLANVWAGEGSKKCMIRHLEVMNGNIMHRMISDAKLIATAPSPVSYTHLTLPTIYSV